jgi:hypothetical protein
MKMTRFPVSSSLQFVGKIIFEHVLVNASNSGALCKKERANNTVTEQPAPNIHFLRTTNVLVNFIWLL